MKDWVVASGLIEGPAGLLLVQNRRRNGQLDWSPPGGVIEVHEGESIADGLTREVREETGLDVGGWDGPVYQVDVLAEGLGWRLHAEVFVARIWSGDVAVDDPDGIVEDARFVPLGEVAELLEGAHPWVREPIGGWLEQDALTMWSYRVDGATSVVALHQR